MAEIIGLLIVMATVLLMEPRLLQWNVIGHKQVQSSVIAEQATVFDKAAEQYLTDNSGLLEATATATTPVIVTAAQLESDGLLPASFSAQDVYGGTWELEVLQPTAGTLNAITLTMGGTSLKDAEAAGIAQLIGAGGGFIPLNDSGAYPQTSPLTAYGTQGAWKLQLTGFSGVAKGELATYLSLIDSTGQLSASDYLYRNAVPGNPALNTMTTPLIMASVQSTGSACTTNGAIAQDGTGALLSCQSGIWTAVGGGAWKLPVATYSDLPASGNTLGDVRLTEDTDRAFAWNGGAWTALAVDQNGNLTVPQHLTAENGQVSTNSGCDGYAGLTVGGVSLWTEPGCGPTDTGINLENPGGVDYQVADQGDDLTIWNGTTGSVFKAHENGEWDSEAGDFVLNGAGNGSEEGNSTWGFQPRYSSGWSMVTSVDGDLNAQAEASPGSIHANDYYDRATGEWFSQVVSQVQSNASNISSLQSSVANQGSDITRNTNNISSLNGDVTNLDYATSALDSEYNSLRSEVSTLESEFASVTALGVPVTYSGIIGPTEQAVTGTCYYYYYPYPCTTYVEEPPEATIPARSYAQIVTVAATVGMSSDGSTAADLCAPWGGSRPPMILRGTLSSGYSLDDEQAAVAVPPDYQTFLTYPMALTLVVPANQSATIELSGGSNGYGCGTFSYAVFGL